MIFKWINTYKEEKVATALLQQWGHTIHTRIELNSSNLLRGGLPAHNNNTEGINNVEKSFFDHRKPLTANFNHKISYMFEDCSKGALSFCSTLHSLVHSINVYKLIYRLLEKSQNGEATFLTVTFEFKCYAIGIGEGSLLIATLSFVDLNIFPLCKQCSPRILQLQCHSMAGQLSQYRKKRYHYIGIMESVTALTVMQLIKKNKMHDEYKRLLQNPEQYSANHTFDDVLFLTRRFLIVEPIVPKNQSNDVALNKCLGFLEMCGLGPISITSLKAMGNEGLISCHCLTYLANASYKHAVAFAFECGIISSFPKTMHHPKLPSIYL